MPKILTLPEMLLQTGLLGLLVHNALQGDWLDLGFLLLIDAPTISGVINRLRNAKACA